MSKSTKKVTFKTGIAAEKAVNSKAPKAVQSDTLRDGLAARDEALIARADGTAAEKIVAAHVTPATEGAAAVKADDAKAARANGKAIVAKARAETKAKRAEVKATKATAKFLAKPTPKASKSTKPVAAKKADAPADKKAPKGNAVLDMMRRTNGATAKDIIAATGWTLSSVQDFVSRTRKKGVVITKTDEGNYFTA